MRPKVENLGYQARVLGCSDFALLFIRHYNIAFDFIGLCNIIEKVDVWEALMISEFVIWKYRSVKGAAILTDLNGFDEINLFDSGQPLLGTFPLGPAFRMNPDFPDEVVLPDNVGNSLQVALISKRFADVLKEEGTRSVEYLPLKILDQMGRLAADSYVIVHPVGLVDCIDLSLSVYKPSRAVEGNIDKVKKLVIDGTRVPSGRNLFKLQGYGEPIVIRRSLAEAIEKRGFTGFGWIEIDQFPKR